jgi:hypothetical protein
MANTHQAEAKKTALEAAITAHLNSKAKAAPLAVGATNEQAEAEAEKAVAEALGGHHPTHMTS